MNVNWSIPQVKLRGNATFRQGYWKCVLVAFIIAVISGGVSSVPNFSGNYNINSIKDENGNFNFSAVYDSSSDAEAIEDLAEEIANSPSFGVIMGTLLVIMIVGIIVSLALTVFLIAPLKVGCMKFFKDAGRTRQYELGSIGFAFSKNYMNIIKIMFMYLLRIFLWSLLFIIPGIIKSYEYRMIPYIISDNPEISTEEAFRISKEMMTGNKWHTFLFDLSFLGWVILSLFTCGILLIFYVDPYIAASEAELYLTLKGEPAPSDMGSKGYDNYSGASFTNGSYGGNNGYQNNYTGSYGYGSSQYSPAPDNSTGYTDGDYRELNQDGKTPDNTSAPANNTGIDNPFNTPY